MSDTITRSRGRVAAVVAGGSLAVTGFATGGFAAPASGQSAVVRLQAHLHPSGDPNGSGEAKLRLNRTAHRVCADIEWHQIGKPTAAHIHRVSDQAVVVDLSGSVTGGAHCTTKASSKLIARIIAHPRRYYVNVHNATYPAGAIQGRLRH